MGISGSGSSLQLNIHFIVLRLHFVGGRGSRIDCLSRASRIKRRVESRDRAETYLKNVFRRPAAAAMSASCSSGASPWLSNDAFNLSISLAFPEILKMPSCAIPRVSMNKHNLEHSMSNDVIPDVSLFRECGNSRCPWSEQTDRDRNVCTRRNGTSRTRWIGVKR